jgi:organic radical activating enzyme
MSEKHSSKNETASQQPAVPVIERLEMHVTHSCNLSCESCCHYSNHKHNGHIDVSEAETWMSAWRGRFIVNEFILLGGEPTINSELVKFIPLVRKYWPEAKLTIVTNGFFLNRHPDLPQALADYGNAQIALSVHHDSSMYRIRLQPILDLIKKWKQDYGISIVVTDSHKNWTRRYLGYGSSMLPFEDNDARKSWEICPARDCKQLFDGKLWKCAPIAYLRLQKQKFDISRKWDLYLNYTPLSATSDNQALFEFTRREDESICSMCSAKRRDFELPNPMTSRP